VYGLFVRGPVGLLVEARVAVLALVGFQVGVNVLVLLELVRSRKALFAVLAAVGLELLWCVHRDDVVLVHLWRALRFAAVLARERLVREVNVMRERHLGLADLAAMRAQLALLERTSIRQTWKLGEVKAV
jgi:hypothetical protein